MPEKKKHKSKNLKMDPVKPIKLTKSQVRQFPELIELYRHIHNYSLREEAYAEVLQTYIHLKKAKLK